MSTDTLHAIANNDTPASVHVPKDMHGLIVWAVGRFGGGILLAAACGWALAQVYKDHAAQTERLITILESRAKADTELAGAILGLRNAVDEVTREAHAAHNGIPYRSNNTNNNTANKP